MRQKMVGAHLDKSLRNLYHRRSMPVRKGDGVIVTRGTFRGTKGTVTKVDLTRLKVYVDTAKRKRASGQETEIALDPSNITILKLVVEDAKRKKSLTRTKGERHETQTT